MCISTRIDLKVIDTKKGSNSYPTLVSSPCGQNMKANISLDKDRLKLKGKGKNIIIPLDLRYGRPWEEPNDDDANILRLYQVIQNNEDTIEINKNEEIYLVSLMSIRHNSDSELYNWKIENYEILAWECWSIKVIRCNKVRSFFLVSLVPKIFEKRVREYLTLVSTINNSSGLPLLRYKERDSPTMHVNEVTKNI